MKDQRDNIIRVDFARGSREPPPSVAPCAREPDPPPERRDDPLASLYSVNEVAKLFGISTSRLRYWDRARFIEPSGKTGHRRYYTFQDLISIRAAKGLLDKGVQLRTVRRSVDALRQSLPKVTRPLSELRVAADGQTVVVHGDGGTYEPATGQLVLDFEVRALRDDVVRVLRQSTGSEAGRRAAYDAYLEGCRLDEDESQLDGAEAAYRRALALDPSLATAMTNLGNLRYRRGHAEEAEQLYRKALEIDAAQPEALYNIGFLCFERRDSRSAASWFRRAIECDPSFADAHFNVAMALEELGQHGDARPHWEAYLRLDGTGGWSEIARRHLDRSQSRD